MKAVMYQTQMKWKKLCYNILLDPEEERQFWYKVGEPSLRGSKVPMTLGWLIL